MKRKLFGIFLTVLFSVQCVLPVFAASNSVEANVARAENVLVRNETDDGYIFPDKTEYMDKDTLQVAVRNLAGKEVATYRIPKAWLSVEEKESTVKNGHQYNLNQLDHTYAAEVFSAFYFDCAQLVDRSDYSMGSADSVQRAILRNILKKNASLLDIELFDTKKAANKRVFDYYITKYKNHKVLFVFAPMKEGICCMVYVFTDSVPHEKDVLYMLQTIEEKS